MVPIPLPTVVPIPLPTVAHHPTPPLCPPAATTASPASAPTHTGVTHLLRSHRRVPPTRCPQLSPPSYAWALLQDRHHPATPSHTPGGSRTRGVGGTCSSRGGKKRGESVPRPPPSSCCQAPAPVFALLTEARAEWAPLCRFPSSACRTERETREEEKKEEEGGGRVEHPWREGSNPDITSPLPCRRPGAPERGSQSPACRSTSLARAHVGFALTVSRALPFLSWLHKSQALWRCRAER